MNARHYPPSPRLPSPLNYDVTRRTRDADIASAVPRDLDALPRLRGFRLRGIEMTRLETFIDAAFAFAITMLVIANGQVPDNIGALLAAFKNVPAFLASIALLGIFWRGHWLWSRRFGLEDAVSILISWAMLVTILIFVYPLRLLFGGMFYLLSDGRMGQAMHLHTATEARALFAVYALGTAAIALEILLLNLRAWQLREPLHLNERERLMTRGELTGWSIPAGVGLLALVLALTLPIREIEWSGWIYFLLFILLPLHKKWMQRRVDSLKAGELAI